MQKQTELIRFKPMTRSAIGMQKEFVVLDIVFHLATTAIDRLVNPLVARRLQIGHHKPEVVAFIRDFRLTDDAP